MDPQPVSRPFLPPVALTLAVCCVFAGWTWDAYGVDTDAFLLPWFAHIREAGPFGAFAQPFSNYTPPYLYLMAASSPLAAVLQPHVVLKLLSFAGHGLLALAVRRLLASLGHAQPWRGAALIAVAPSLFISPAVLVQCDSFWAAAIVMALVASIERRHTAMFAWCGLAVAFKLQAVFAAPFFLSLAIARHVPLPTWTVAPAAAVASLLPAWAMGWPAGDLLTIYFRQTQWEDALALNAPNLWMIVQHLPAAAETGLNGVASAAALIASLCFVLFFSQRLDRADAVTLLRAACLCAMLVPGLLPRMHERYFFLSDVFALVLVIVRPAEWRVALLTQIGSGLAILAYMTGETSLAVFGAVAMITATWLVARPLVGGQHVSGRSAASGVRPV
jgi:Gpi18-like mannosyltransferase